MTDELQPGAVVDRYRVEGVLGRGGMAAVYRVRHTQLDTLHALKVLELTHPQLRTRLLAEGRVQARIAHPNVVAVSDVLEVGGHPGLLMELVRGPSLDQLLGDGALPLELVDAIVPHVLAGVAAAHAHGVVHRDLKPANVLLHVRAEGLVAKVGDFGLVKAEGEGGQTRTGMTMGTPAYMSPEQIRNTRDVDLRTDVFALGALLYELVTGRRAFDGDSAFEIQEHIVREEFPRTPPWDDLPERVRRAIEGALRADRDVRLPSAVAVWEVWSGGGVPLEVAAARPIPLTGALVEAAARWTSEAPSSAVPTPATGGGTWTDSLPERPAPAVVQPSPTSSSVTASRAGLALGAALAAGLAATVAGGGLVAALGLGVWLVPAESVEGPAPEPVAAQVVARPPPELEVDPAPAPLPAPVEAPAPAPPPPPRVPTVPPPPAPTPAPLPAPTAGATATVRVLGDVPVRLVPATGGAALAPGDLPVGTWKVEAQFDGRWDMQGKLVLGPGDVRTVQCAQGTRSCQF